MPGTFPLFPTSMLTLSALLTSVDISIVIGVIRLQDVAALSTRLEKLVDVNTASATGIDINELFC